VDVTDLDHIFKYLDLALLLLVLIPADACLDQGVPIGEGVHQLFFGFSGQLDWPELDFCFPGILWIVALNTWYRYDHLYLDYAADVGGVADVRVPFEFVGLLSQSISDSIPFIMGW
jgi:hypothetical protein